MTLQLHSLYGQQLLYQAIANHHLAAGAMADWDCTGKTDTGLPCHSIYHQEGKEKIIIRLVRLLLCVVTGQVGAVLTGSSYLRTSSQALQTSEVTESSKNKDLQHPIGCLTQIERPNHHIYVLIAIKYI